MENMNFISFVFVFDEKTWNIASGNVVFHSRSPESLCCSTSISFFELKICKQKFIIARIRNKNTHRNTTLLRVASPCEISVFMLCILAASGFFVFFFVCILLDSVRQYKEIFYKRSDAIVVCWLPIENVRLDRHHLELFYFDIL